MIAISRSRIAGTNLTSPGYLCSMASLIVMRPSPADPAQRGKRGSLKRLRLVRDKITCTSTSEGAILFVRSIIVGLLTALCVGTDAFADIAIDRIPIQDGPRVLLIIE